MCCRTRELAAKYEDYLYDELAERTVKDPISIRLLAHVGVEGDPTKKTAHWPKEREKVDLGTIKLDRVVQSDAENQRHIIYDPIPRVDGVEASDDYLLDMRAAAYVISGKTRRAAPKACLATLT
jgi:catalase